MPVLLSGVERLAGSGIGTDVEPLAEADALGRYGGREEASPTQPRGVKLDTKVDEGAGYYGYQSDLSHAFVFFLIPLLVHVFLRKHNKNVELQ